MRGQEKDSVATPPPAESVSHTHTQVLTNRINHVIKPNHCLIHWLPGLAPLPSMVHWSGVGICCFKPLQKLLMVSILSLRWMKSLSSSCSSRPCPVPVPGPGGVGTSHSLTLVSALFVVWLLEKFPGVRSPLLLPASELMDGKHVA